MLMRIMELHNYNFCLMISVVLGNDTIENIDLNTWTYIDLSITVPLAPGLIIRDESNFSHNNLKIKWTAPVDTVVTKYEITLNGTTYYAMNEDPIYQFNGKDFVPGESYEISIVTVSGTTLDSVKKSSEHTEWIRTIPTSKRNTINKMYK